MRSAAIDEVASAIVTFLNAEIMAPGHGVGTDDGLAAAGIDSMALLRVLLFVECTYGLWIPDEDLVDGNVATPRALARYVTARVGVE